MAAEISIITSTRSFTVWIMSLQRSSIEQWRWVEKEVNSLLLSVWEINVGTPFFNTQHNEILLNSFQEGNCTYGSVEAACICGSYYIMSPGQLTYKSRSVVQIGQVAKQLMREKTIGDRWMVLLLELYNLWWFFD